jgi:hypothetical protein
MEKSELKKEIRQLRAGIGEAAKAEKKTEVRKLRRRVKKLKRKTRQLATAAKAAPKGDSAPPVATA